MLHKMGTVELVLHALRKCNSMGEYLAIFDHFSNQANQFGNLGHTLQCITMYCNTMGFKEEMSNSIGWLGGYELVSWFNICCNGSDILVMVTC